MASAPSRLALPLFGLGGRLDHPVPTFGRELVGIASKRHRVGGRHRVAGLLIDQTKLVIRVFLKERGIILVMSSGIVEIT